MRRVLVTGSGGIGGVNFVRALREGARLEGDEILIVGTDFNPYHLELPDLDARYRTPRHSDPSFVPTVLSIAERHGVEFLHPHPSVEARVVSENRRVFEERGIRLYLPEPREIAPDKAYIHEVLSRSGVPVPRTVRLENLGDVDRAFEELGSPLWIRAVRGAGGRLSLLVRTPEEARLWVKLNVVQGRATVRDFILQEYLPGRDVAFDSLWYEGRLVTSYARERLEYPFRHISLSGVTGTPSVARIIVDEKINRVGEAAVRALSKRPHGFYSVDIKEDAEGRPVVTEVDGKWHTTAPLWGYSFARITGKNSYNLVYTYLRLGYGDWDGELPRYNLYPEGYCMVRQMDCGVVILGPGGGKWRVV